MSIIPVNVNQVIHNASPYYLGLALNAAAHTLPDLPVSGKVGIGSIKTLSAKAQRITVVLSTAYTGGNDIAFQVFAMLPDGSEVELTALTTLDDTTAASAGQHDVALTNDDVDLPAGTALYLSTTVTGVSHPVISWNVQCA